MAASSSNVVLDRLLDPVARCLTPESASHLVGLRADPVAQARVEQLAEASTEGRLSPEELAEYEACVAVATFVAILQAKSRTFLAHTGGAGRNEAEPYNEL